MLKLIVFGIILHLIYGFLHNRRKSPLSKTKWLKLNNSGDFGGDDEPEMNIPAPPQLKTASQIFPEAISFGRTNYPLAYGAREQALSDIINPQYYSRFQPTSFEDALANQYFKNVWPDVQRQTLHGLSLAGIESSPITGELLGKQYGNIATTIGEYLANLGNTRATNALNARLGIDPYSTYSPYAETDISQSNAQANLDYQYALQQAQQNYQNAMNKYKQKQAGIGSAFGLGGAGIGALLAGALAIPTGGISLAALPGILGAAGAGAGLGSSIGGYAAPLFGGSAGGGLDIGTALSLMDMLSPSGIGGLGKAQKVGSTKNISDLFSGLQPELGMIPYG